MTVHVSVHGFFIVRAYSIRDVATKKVIHAFLGDELQKGSGDTPLLRVKSMSKMT